MTLSLCTLRPLSKLLLAYTLGVFVIMSPQAIRPVSAQSPPASQTLKQPGNKAGNPSSNRPVATPGLPGPRPGWTYPQRQTLTYEVDWRVFPAGTATVHLESNGDAQRVTVTGDSTGAINLLYRVSDHFQSTFSRQTGCSTVFAKQLMEGTRQISSDQQFSQGQSRATIDEKTLITHGHRVEQTTIPVCVSDALSAILYAASQPLQVGQTFHVPVVYAENVLDITAHVEAHEAVRTPSTTYQTVRVQPTWTNSAVRNSGNIWVWYTDDDRHIPVQVRARLFWGTITFRLTGLDSK